MKQTYITLSIITALTLTACGGSSSDDSNYNAPQDNNAANSASNSAAGSIQNDNKSNSSQPGGDTKGEDNVSGNYGNDSSDDGGYYTSNYSGNYNRKRIIYSNIIDSENHVDDKEDDNKEEVKEDPKPPKKDPEPPKEDPKPTTQTPPTKNPDPKPPVDDKKMKQDQKDLEEIAKIKESGTVTPELKELVKKHNATEGDGPIVVHWGDRFKAMNSNNPNLLSGGALKNLNNKDEIKTKYIHLNEDGTRRHLDTKWDKISITAPNTIVGHDSEKAKNYSGPKKYNPTHIDAPFNKPVKDTVTLDLSKTEIEIKLKDHDNNPVKLTYKTSVENLGEENGKYVAQSVHIFGTATNNPVLTKKDKEFVEMAYIYGVVTPDGSGNFDSFPQDKKVTYEGIATYLPHYSNREATKDDIKKGTSKFVVNFNDSHEPKITDGEIKIEGIDPATDTFNVSTDKLKYEASSFFTKKQDPVTKKWISAYNNSGEFEKGSEGPNLRIHGRFYGTKAQYIGGTFYLKDIKGAGTFFGGDTDKGKAVKW